MKDYTESVRIEYNPDMITFRELVKTYFRYHSPTSRNISKQYRSAIFFGSEEEREICEEVVEEMQKKKYGDNMKIHLDIEPWTEFYRGEEYHQNYLQMMGKARY